MKLWSYGLFLKFTDTIYLTAIKVFLSSAKATEIFRENVILVKISAEIREG
jgi:hypothetical protein